MTTRKTYLTIIVGAVVALTPPVLVYLQSRAELRERAARTEAEANAGYQTLVNSVHELQATVSAQHDAITKMQGYLEALQQLAPGLRMTARPPAILPQPSFRELPANIEAAQAKQ